VSGKATPERLADLLVERMWPMIQAELREINRPEADEWITAEDCARRYEFSATWWRARVDEYGKRCGTGPRPRLLFSVRRIERTLESGDL
jgi:hypothetical protein